MRRKTRKITDRELADLLRRGDPAADGRDPRPDEIARMRRAVLAEAHGAAAPGRTAGWRSWVARAAVAATAVVAVLTLWSQLPGPDAPPSPRPGASAGGPAVGDTGKGDSDPRASSPPMVLPEGPRFPSQRPVPDLPAAVDAEAGTALAPTPAAADATGPPSTESRRPARTVRFTIPGGTRIIWKLDPDFHLPTAGSPGPQ